MSSILSKLINLAGNITGTLPVANGGTGLASGTSGGVLGYTASGTLASSGALTIHGVVIGGGAGATPTVTAVGTNGQLLIGNTSADPTWGNTVSAATTFSAALNANALLDNSGGSGLKLPTSGGTAGTLDFYEQSLTWTPTLSFSGGNGTAGISTTFAKWNRIGKMIFMDFYISVTKGDRTTQALNFGGMPYASTASTNYHSLFPVFQNATSATWLGHVGSNTSLINFYKDSSGTTVTGGDMAATTVFGMTMTYRTD